MNNFEKNYFSIVDEHFIDGCACCLWIGDKTTEKGTSDNKEAKVLKMGTSADYAPFEYIDTKKGELIGIDIELAKVLQ